MITNSEKETIKLGKKLGSLLEDKTVICLYGPLGSGKTTFTKGVGEGLEVNSIINSPTFTVVKMYNGRLPLNHIDAYRLENNDYDLGLDELFDNGITVIEWPEYLKDYLPNDYLEIYFDNLDENKRDIKIISKGKKYEEIVRKMEC